MNRSEILSLDGKIALVAGGCGDIGRSVAEHLRDAGAQVLVADVADRAPPEGTELVSCDVTHPDEVARVFDDISERFGGLDLLVHSAGITRDGVIWKLDSHDWEEVISVNLDSAFYLLRAAVPVMRVRGSGSIVLIASINGERGKFGQSNYSASKAGLIGLGRTAAVELSKFGIRVNTVSPGFIETAMTEKIPREFIDKAIGEIALGRAGRPDDVARVVWFLCSEMSRHMTGQVLRVDGGQLIA